jgi:hypothetical protein
MPVCRRPSGDTHLCLHSMLDLDNPHVLAGAEWCTEEYKPRLLARGWDPIKAVTSSTTSGFGDGLQSTLLYVAKAVPFRLRHHDGSTTLYFYDVAVPRPRVALSSVNQPGVCASVDYGDIYHPFRGKAFRVLIMTDDFSGRVYASIVDDASVTGDRTAKAFMMLTCETFAKVTIDPDTRFDNKFFRTLLGRMRTEVRTVPTDSTGPRTRQILCIYSE